MNAIKDTKIYVRYCETDAGGHVNNISYFIYLEEARTRFFEALNISSRDREDYSFVIAHTECNYVEQAYAGQNLRVSSKVSRIGTKSFSMAHDITEASSGKLIAQGTAVIVCFKFDEQKSIEIPQRLRDTLEGLLEN